MADKCANTSDNPGAKRVSFQDDEEVYEDDANVLEACGEEHSDTESTTGSEGGYWSSGDDDDAEMLQAIFEGVYLSSLWLLRLEGIQSREIPSLFLIKTSWLKTKIRKPVKVLQQSACICVCACDVNM